MDDRMTIAKAMGWTNFINDQVGLPPGAKHKSPATQGHQFPPDPFTDANDDYAVLEWMRDKYDSQIVINALESLDAGNCCDLYEIGNFARAALKVINDV